MFAIASIFLILGVWAVAASLFDWDSCWGVLDIRATGEALGDDNRARWLVGGSGALLLLLGLLIAL